MSVEAMTVIWNDPACRRLPAGQKVTLLRLADMCNDEGLCWPSVARLCADMGKRERQVRHDLAELKKSGLIEPAGSKGRNVVIWRLTFVDGFKRQVARLLGGQVEAGESGEDAAGDISPTPPTPAVECRGEGADPCSPAPRPLQSTAADPCSPLHPDPLLEPPRTNQPRAREGGDAVPGLTVEPEAVRLHARLCDRLGVTPASNQGLGDMRRIAGWLRRGLSPEAIEQAVLAQLAKARRAREDLAFVPDGWGFFERVMAETRQVEQASVGDDGDPLSPERLSAMGAETAERATRARKFWRWAGDHGLEAARQRWAFLCRRDGPPPDSPGAAGLNAELFAEIRDHYGPGGQGHEVVRAALGPS